MDFFFFSPLVPFIIIVTYPRSSKLKNLRWNTSNSGPYNYILFTLFENHPKYRILAFSINFCTIKIELSGNTVWPQASGFQKLVKIDHFWPFFIEHLSTQNVNVARSDVERDFFCDFQTPWLFSEYKVQWSNSLWCYSSCNGHIELLVLEAIKYHVFQNVVLNTLIDK